MSSSRGVGVLVVAVACLLAPVALAAADVRTEIAALAEQWETKFNSGDIAGVAALYAEDGQLLPPESDFATGRAAIQQFWQGAYDSGMGKLKFELLEVHGTGSEATEVGAIRSPTPRDRRSSAASTSCSGRRSPAPGSCTATSGTRARLPGAGSLL